MKFTSFLLISAFWILCAGTTLGHGSSAQEALISCMKIKRQAPYLNLKCEELLKKHEEYETLFQLPDSISFKTNNLRQEVGDEANGIKELSLSEITNTKKVS